MFKAKILVVEDEEFLRQLYVNLLKDQGYQVDDAKDGEEAYQVMSKNDYDLVLLDYQLPKLDGDQVLERLKVEAPGKKLGPIVFLSNMDKDFIKSRNSNSASIKGYLIKSDYTPDQFVTEVKKFLV